MTDLKQLAAQVRKYWAQFPPTMTVRNGISEPGERLLAAIETHDCATAELVAALRQTLVALGALGDDIDDESDLGRDDKPNQAMRLSMKHSAQVNAAYDVARAVLARHGGT